MNPHASAEAVNDDFAADSLPPGESSVLPERRDAAIDLAGAVSLIGSRLGDLSVNIADTSGTVFDVAGDLSSQAAAFHDLTGAIQRISTSTGDVAEVAREAVAAAAEVHSGLSGTTDSIEKAMSAAISDIRDMARSSTEVIDEFDSVVEQISEVSGSSESIRSIASETQMLAINAGIMAAHAGEAGRGFAVIAESVRQLADQTSTVSRDIVTRLERLQAAVQLLQEQNRSNAEKASGAVARSASIDGEIQKFHDFGKQFDAMTSQIGGISEPVERAGTICGEVLDQVTELDRMGQENVRRLEKTSKRFDNLVSFSEEMILLVEESGIETEDSPLIRACIDAANATAAMFENAVRTGDISMGDLFDENYREIANTNPRQVWTRFSDFTDRVMPPVQEGFLEVDPRIVFCAAVDRNGYLPTHNHKYSRPQSTDPVWNAANCRNRRIFKDRTGLSAGRNTRSFLLQTYRRDMGGGKYQLMKDLSSPIFVDGRHWGGLRVGFSTRAG